jgi:hypothetical protein
MANKKPAGGSPAIEAEHDYRVAFAKPFVRGRQRFSPVHTYVLKGRVLAEIPADHVRSAVPEEA